MKRLPKPILAIIILTTMYLACSFTPTPDQVVVMYKNAVNSHNVESVMSFYSEDILFEVPDLAMCVEGKEAMRGVSEYDSVLNTEMKLSDVTVSGDMVICSLTETNDWMNAAGIGMAFYPEVEFVVIDQKIHHIHADMADSSQAKFDSVIGTFVPWAHENHAEEMFDMMPEGDFIFNGENAAMMVKLLTEWREQAENTTE
jgi:hypothetical protein